MTASASGHEKRGTEDEESAQAGPVSRVPRPSPHSIPPVLLLIDPPAAGPWNMAVDEALLESAEPGQCVLRFYQWQEPTLSLGYFQRYDDRWQHAPSRECAVVRRASGGGAILHDRELTYSLIVVADHPLAADRLGLYRAMHLALIDALTHWNIHAALFEPSSNPSKTNSLLKKGTGSEPTESSPAEDRGREASAHLFQQAAKEPFLCFQRRAPGDVVLNDVLPCRAPGNVLLDNVKIAGSAQRRSQRAVLQHGSVLLRRSIAAPELPGINDQSGQTIEPHDLIEAWLQRLDAWARNPWEVGNLSTSQRTRAAELVDTKYQTSIWTQDRGRL